MDINKGVLEYKNTSGAVLIDVRTPEEYGQTHIDGSINIPITELRNVKSAAASLDTPLFIYCHSGHRSGRATVMLREMGYTNVKNIGGIVNYNVTV